MLAVIGKPVLLLCALGHRIGHVACRDPLPGEPTLEPTTNIHAINTRPVLVRGGDGYRREVQPPTARMTVVTPVLGIEPNRPPGTEFQILDTERLVESTPLAYVYGYIDGIKRYIEVEA